MENLLKRLEATATVPKVDDLFSGTWKNELNSEMRLVVTGQHVKGTYHTAVGQPTSKKSELVGFVLGDIITFTVNFGNSLATWAGQIEPVKGQADELVTLWHLVANTLESNESTEAWKDTFAGADTFKKM